MFEQMPSTKANTSEAVVAEQPPEDGVGIREIRDFGLKR